MGDRTRHIAEPEPVHAIPSVDRLVEQRSPWPASTSRIHALHRAIGNRAVEQLLNPRAAGAAAVQQHGRSPVRGGQPPCHSELPPDVERTVREGGTPLDPAIRWGMEAKFGEDLSSV